MNDYERWERITAAKGDPSPLPEDDAAFREAWLGMTQGVESKPSAWSLDPDDVFAEISRRERRQRRSYWIRGGAVAASLFVIVAVVANVVWNSLPHVNGRKNEIVLAPKPVEATPWEDGWETSAQGVEEGLAANADLFHPPPMEAWIDRQIRVLFEECVRVWETF